MIRLRYISDPDLRERIRAIIAEARGMSPSQIGDWWELDDAEYSEILIRLNHAKPNPDELPEA
jgi:hypothetical protein